MFALKKRGVLFWLEPLPEGAKFLGHQINTSFFIILLQSEGAKAGFVKQDVEAGFVRQDVEAGFVKQDVKARLLSRVSKQDVEARLLSRTSKQDYQAGC